jgi:hypothetical protein
MQDRDDDDKNWRTARPHREARSERGYRGEAASDTPPGSVPGGSYGGGGGYSPGGYSRGNYDPSVEGRREHGSGGWKRSGQPRQDGSRHEGGRHGGRYGGAHERGEWAGREPRGDWRRGYGGYGLGEPGRDPWDDQEPGRDRYDDRDYEEMRGGYGLGGGDVRHSERGRDEGDVPWTYMEPWAVPGPFTGRGPSDYRRSEDAIREEVCERLTRHGALDASGIRVRVEEGEVILEGSVGSRSAKRMAEDAAETVSGVRDVHNRLRIERDDGGRDDARRDDSRSGDDDRR